MTKSYERGLFNGNVLVAKKGKIIYQKSFGFTDETKKTPLTKNSILNFGSIAKEFNAMRNLILDGESCYPDVKRIILVNKGKTNG